MPTMKRDPHPLPSHQELKGHISMNLSRRSLLATATALGMAPQFIGRTRAQTGKSVSIALDWFPNANHAGLIWADAEGLFAAANLDVTLVIPADPTTVLQTVAAGRDTFGISYQPDIMLARAEELPVVAVASIVPRPLLGVMSLDSSGIRRPADLEGKIVGYTGIPSQEAFLRTMLREDNVSIDDIELNNIEFNLLPSLISGTAAAVMGAFWTHETIVAEQEGYPVAMMRVEDWGVPMYNELVLVAAESTVIEEPDMVVAVVAAMRTGYLAAAADQARALDLLIAAYPETDRTVEELGLALLAEVWTSSGHEFGSLVPDDWQVFADWMIAEALLPSDFDASGVVSPLAIPANLSTPIA